MEDLVEFELTELLYGEQKPLQDQEDDLGIYIAALKSLIQEHEEILAERAELGSKIVSSWSKLDLSTTNELMDGSLDMRPDQI